MQSISVGGSDAMQQRKQKQHRKAFLVVQRDFWICRTLCKACACSPGHPSIGWFELVRLNLLIVCVFWYKSGGALAVPKSEVLTGSRMVLGLDNQIAACRHPDSLCVCM